MKFSLTTLYVKDMEKSLEFYNTLIGLPIVRRQVIGEDKELVFLGDGDTLLELIPSDGNVQYAGFSIGFDVDDLLEAKERLENNGYKIKREMSPNSSLTLCFLDGPNGEEVELLEYKH
ncbi:MAG: Glyoxalase/bleomycin resistance protein/dioxygenase [Herbinix sp.]|jgi:lactoylglutathione lyase|nr:Glyoxalase/bleomycin resistance protein/dioxygenase [Herbinix sp.]